MKKRFISFGIYSLFWLVFFISARLFFILFHFHNSAAFSVPELFATFWNGSKLDVSTVGYYLLLPVLVAIPGVFLKGNWYKYFMRWYSYLLIIFSSIIVISDANLYAYWGFRMDYTPMLYLRTPGEAMASVSGLKTAVFFLSIIISSFLFIFLYNRIVDRYFDGFEKVRFGLAGVLALMLFWGALVIPIRGGFGVAPINAGSVYFSNKMYLNHTAVNAIWNVGTSAFTQKPVNNPYQFGDIDEAHEIVSNLIADDGETEVVLRTSRPNIILLVLESFSGYLIGPMGGDSLVTPNFNRFAREGIIFSNFYASGTRTDKAMPAVLDGYPAQPAQSIIKEPKKSQSLPSLVRILSEEGYKTSFWYGGEINFANFNSFVIGSGFNSIITKDNFDPEDYNSKWGVHDHIMFRTLKDSMEVVKQPFLNVILTLSSHEPFDVPMDPVFDGDDNLTKYKNSVYYADKALGSFIEWARTTEWWDSTLVIMVADHCCRISSDMTIYKQDLFSIPMVWIGGALSKSGVNIRKHGSQVDIPLTLLNQLNIKYDFPFAKDLLSNGSNSFAFYTYNEGFGFITDTSAIIYDQKLRDVVIKEGDDTGLTEKSGKAYLQVLFDDYLKR